MYLCPLGILIGIDFGLKRTGIAATDELQLIASAVDTIPTKEVMAFLIDLVSKKNTEAFVIGLPLRLNDEMSAIEVNILEFIKALEKQFPAVAIHREDERFTSKMAMQAMIDGGMKKKDRRKKENLDKISATIILQAFLERTKY
jgi:putative Holliday junction resolvase